MDLMTLQRALESSWGEDTQQSPSGWDEINPAQGQCAVSSMIVQREAGGRILRGSTSDGTIHYWNELPGGAWYDSTRAQFDDHELIVEYAEADVSLYLFEDTRERFAVLSERVDRILSR